MEKLPHSNGLRRRIEKVGQEILKNYCQKGYGNAGPIMIPPIPVSKFIDKLPTGVSIKGQNAAEKALQDGYEAEVRIYRFLERVHLFNVIILHQLEFTHEQYSAFLPFHDCGNRKCNQGPHAHYCHKPKKNREGENDFVVIGDYFAVSFEVKGLQRNDLKDQCWEVTMSGCCNDALKQRERIVNLIKSLDASLLMFQFTVFTNLSMMEVEKKFSCDETLLFKEDVENIPDIISFCDVLSKISSKVRLGSSHNLTVKHCLLGLWCIDDCNNWDSNSCSLNKCMLEIDWKLRQALLTRKAIDESSTVHKKTRKDRKGKRKLMNKSKSYPDNLEMVEAPEVFQKYLNIRCLSKDQLDVFNCTDPFLWIEGPAGCGKTIVLLGKMIHHALTTPPETRILLIMMSAHVKTASDHLKLLTSLSETTDFCTIIEFSYKNGVGSNSMERLESASTVLLQRLSESISKIILLNIEEVVFKSEENFLELFDYVFVDDYQALLDNACLDQMNDNPDDRLYLIAKETIIANALIPFVLKQNSSNKTSVWILSDMAQSYYERFAPFTPDQCGHPLKTAWDVHNELRYNFRNVKQLSTNLRNVYEISTVLSIVRSHSEKRGIGGRHLGFWPKQNHGHFLRGTKPVIYLLSDFRQVLKWLGIVEKELCRIYTSDCSLKNSDIAVIVGTALFPDDSDKTLEGCATLLGYLLSERFGSLEDNLASLGNTIACASAEWPAVISIQRHIPHPHASRPNEPQCPQICNLTPPLYIALSRARVHCVVIIVDYMQGRCSYADELFAQLRERRDVCSIVDVENE